MKVQRTRRGWRMVQDGAVLSEILSSPGPTHSVFDVLAACLSVLVPGPRAALLGFAGGGMVAPLRAMGWEGSVEGVDLDSRGEALFRDLSSAWCGAVEFSREDAIRWLGRRRRRYDAIIDDLSVPRGGEVTKPPESHDGLPDLVARRLAVGGVAIVNALPVPGLGWEEQMARIVAPHAEARMVQFLDFENRILVSSSSLPATRRLGGTLRAALGRIGSRIGGRISVRGLAP